MSPQKENERTACWLLALIPMGVLRGRGGGGKESRTGRRGLALYFSRPALLAFWINKPKPQKAAWTVS